MTDPTETALPHTAIVSPSDTAERLVRMQADMRAVLAKLKDEGKLTYDIERQAAVVARCAEAMIEGPCTDDFKKRALASVETFTAMCRGN